MWSIFSFEHRPFASPLSWKTLQRTHCTQPRALAKRLASSSRFCARYPHPVRGGASRSCSGARLISFRVTSVSSRVPHAGTVAWLWRRACPPGVTLGPFQRAKWWHFEVSEQVVQTALPEPRQQKKQATLFGTCLITNRRTCCFNSGNCKMERMFRTCVWKLFQRRQCICKTFYDKSHF